MSELEPQTEIPTTNSVTASMSIPPEIASALVKIQKKLEPLERSSDNEEYGSKYTPIEVVMPFAMKLLTKYDIAVSQPPVTLSDGASALATILIHKSGACYQTTTKLAVAKVDPQVHGSSITYMKRYALMAVLGITTKGEDDDGNKAAGVFPKVTEEQLAEIKSLCTAMRFTKEMVADKIFNIKTRDHAFLAIKNLNEQVAQRARDDESKARASFIEYGAGPADDAPILPDDDSINSPAARMILEDRMIAVGMTTKAMRNKFIFAMTDKPFLENCVDSDRVLLSECLIPIESGVRELPKTVQELRPPETVNNKAA